MVKFIIIKGKFGRQTRVSKLMENIAKLRKPRTNSRAAIQFCVLLTSVRVQEISECRQDQIQPNMQ